MAQDEQLIRLVLYANIVMYIISLLFNPRLTSLSLNPLHFMSPDSNSLFMLGATGTVPVNQLGRWWTLLAANYLHGGILHIAFNMIACIDGLLLNNLLGNRRFDLKWQLDFYLNNLIEMIRVPIEAGTQTGFVKGEEV